MIIPGATAWHWINLVAFGALSFAAYRIIDHFGDEATAAEHKAGFVQNEIFTLWGTIALILVLALNVSVSTTLVLCLLPLAWNVWRVVRHRLRFAQWSAFVLMLAFIGQVVIGALDTNSIVISRQPLWSWIAMLEWLAVAWGMHRIYQRYDINGRGAALAAQLHQLVFWMPALLVALAWRNIVHNATTHSFVASFGYPWFDLWIIAALLGVLLWVVSKTETPQPGQSRTRHRLILLETASFLAALLFLDSVFIVAGEWVFNAAAISLLLLLAHGVKHKLPVTEKLAWGHFLLFGVMLWLAWLRVGNLHFSEQDLSTQLGLIELLLCGWAVQEVYQRLRPGQPGQLWARRVRIAVYCVIPLLLLPRTWRLTPQYFATALWASFFIDWLMFKKLKIEALRRELEILFIAAFGATVMIALAAILGAQQWPGLLALLGGLAMLTLFNGVEKTLAQSALEDSPYRLIQWTTPYFFAIALSGLSFAAMHNLMLAMLLPGLYLVSIIQYRKLRVLLRKSLILAYMLSWSLLTAVPLLSLLGPWMGYSEPMAWLALVLNILALAGLWWLTHHRSAVLCCMRRRFGGRLVQLWIFHGIVLIAYAAVLNLFFSAWSMALSIAMLIHAVIVLMLTLKPQYQGLLRLSIMLYGLTAIKLLFYDMSGAGNLQKVFALMGIGSILMAAAYLFQKLRSQALTAR